MLFLKQSTACNLKIGPFLDNGDGYTAETGLTVSQADVRLSKNGGNIAQKSDATSCTHDALGFYLCPLNATDTNTLGRLQLIVAESGALPVFHDFMVVTANVYDTVCGSDSLMVDLNASQGAVTIGTVGTVNNVGDKTGYALSAAGVDAVWDEVITGHTTASTYGLTVWNLLRLLANKRAIAGTTETCYADNGTDALFQWTLDSATPPISSKTPV